MNDFKPLVSVIIPTIPSRSQLLTRALASVQAQTYGMENIEVVVVNEGLPAPTQRNIGIERSHGDFIAFLDDDDTWYPEKISKQMEYMCRYPDVSIVTCYSEDHRYGEKYIDRPPNIVHLNDILNSLNYSSTSAYLIKNGGLYFDVMLPSAQEYELAIRLLKSNKKALCVPEVLVTQNASKNQISENWRQKKDGLMMVYGKHKHLFRKASMLNPVKVRVACLLFGSRFSGKLIRWFKRKQGKKNVCGQIDRIVEDEGLSVEYVKICEKKENEK